MKLVRDTFFFALLTIGLLVTACATPTVSPTAIPPTSQPTALPNKGEIRIAFAAEADFDDLPALEAIEILQAQGYTITPTFYSGTSLGFVKI